MARRAMGSLRAPYSRLRRRGGFFPGPGSSPGSASFRAGSSSASSDQKLRDPCLLLSNDDGVEAPGLLVLTEHLRLSTGMRCVVVAPDGDRSGAGMALTLRQPMALKERPDLGPDVYAVGGTPADCALCALDPGRGLLASLGLTPKLMVSGINAGPNLGFDVLFSGTFGAARTGAMFGVPSVAASLAAAPEASGGSPPAPADFSHAAQGLGALVWFLLGGLEGASAPPGSSSYPRPDQAPGAPDRRYAPGGFQLMQEGARSGVPGAWELPQDAASLRLLLGNAFRRADVLLNVNVPPGWELNSSKWGGGGGFAPAGLGVSQYRGTLKTLEGGSGYVTGSGEYYVDPDVAGCDISTVRSGKAAVSTLQTWPEGHALCLGEAVMAAAHEAGDGGMPAWITEMASSASGTSGDAPVWECWTENLQLHKN